MITLFFQHVSLWQQKSPVGPMPSPEIALEMRLAFNQLAALAKWIWTALTKISVQQVLVVDMMLKRVYASPLTPES